MTLHPVCHPIHSAQTSIYIVGRMNSNYGTVASENVAIAAFGVHYGTALSKGVATLISVSVTCCPTARHFPTAVQSHRTGVTFAAAWVETFSRPGIPNLLPPHRNLPAVPRRNSCDLLATQPRASEPAALRLFQFAASPCSETVR